MLLFWRERTHFGAIYVFGMLTLPMVPQPIAFGDLYLLDFSFGNAYTIGAILGMFIGGHARKSMFSFADIPVAAIITVFYLASVRETSATNAMREFFNYLLSYALPYYVVSRCIQGPKQAQSVMFALAGSAVVLSAIAIFEVWRAWPLYRGIWAHYGIQLGSGASVKLRGGLIRAPGPYSEPLSLAFAMTVGFIALLSIRKFIAKRWHYALLCLLVVIGLIAPQGRGAWIGALFALLAIDLYRREFRRLSVKAFLILIAGTLALSLAAISNRVAIMLGQTSEGQGTLDYREQLLARGIEEFWKNPLFGDAIGDVLANMRDLIQGEGIVDLVNGYLHIALISGAAGLFIILACLIGIGCLFWQIHNRYNAPTILRDTVAFAFTSLIAIAVMLTGISIVGRSLLVLLIVIGCGAAASRTALFAKRKVDILDGKAVDIHYEDLGNRPNNITHA